MSETKKKHRFKGERTQSTIIIVIGLVLFLAAIIANFRIGFTLIVAAISAMAVYELEKAVGAKSKALFAVSAVASVFTVFAVSYQINIPHIPVIYSFFVLLLLCMTVVLNQVIKYEHAVMAFFACVCVPYSLSCFIRLNDIADVSSRYTHFEGIYLVMMAFSCSWLTDVFAFLVGRKIGKHKMTPNISPKKSVEGAVFGTIITAAINVIVLAVFELVSKKIGHGSFMWDSSFKYLYIVPISCLLSVVSMFGDLAASVLKRNVGIKDYSNILPGHGGIVDRFDSSLFVLPVLYGIFRLMN